jgi:two-component system, chemotaxis family, response regulator Rcp1
MEEPTTQRTILLIEHDRARSQLIATALQTDGHRVIPLESGEQALAYLDRCGRDEDKPRPDLILLELNLPDRDGREILAEIKARSTLRRIPIVVLTTAASADDIFNTYIQQGNCHVVKSDDLIGEACQNDDRLLTIVRRIEAFWLGLVTLPMA